MLIAKNKRQARNVYLVSAAFLPIIRLLVMLIGLSALVLYPNIDAKDIFPRIIQGPPYRYERPNYSRTYSYSYVYSRFVLEFWCGSVGT